jgi:hypothetical protein
MNGRTRRVSRSSVHELGCGGIAREFSTGVSLHAHTHYSRESMTDVPQVMGQIPFLGKGLERELRTCIAPEGAALDFSRMRWHPPVSPRAVFESEAGQIEQRLGLAPLVSVTDHDDILAGLELQTLYAQRRSPISFEWTVPCGRGYFHLGVHNLPPASADAWFARLADVTARPSDAAVTESLRDLDAEDGVLVVLNHPQWDLAGVGRGEHTRLLHDFLDGHASRLHALELNGYRSWKENASVQFLALKTNLPLISGGDRHGAEPNALLNLSNAQSFGEFAAEVRDGLSQVVVMPEYRRHLATRVIASVNDVLRRQRTHAAGRRLWTDRVSWDAAGCVRTLSCRWPDGGPLWVRSAIRALNMAASPAGLRALGVALDLFERVTARETFTWAPNGRPRIGALGVDAN